MCCQCQQRFAYTRHRIRHERDKHRLNHNRSATRRNILHAVRDSSDSSVPPDSDSDSSFSMTPLQSPEPSPRSSPLPSPSVSPPQTSNVTPVPTPPPPPPPLSITSSPSPSGPSGGSSSGGGSASSSGSPGLICESCLMVFSNARNLRDHRPCRFLFDQNFIDQNQIPVTILTKPRNLEATMKTLMLLPDVDMVNLAIIQGWWIPKVYPFIFPGHLRAGPKGLHPVLKDCTANENSTKLLKLLVRVEGRADLPRNIVLVHPNLTKSFLPQTVLTPPVQTFNYQILETTFSVSPTNVDPSDQSSLNQSDDDDITFNSNPARQSANNDDNLDDTVVEEASRPHSQVRAVMDLNKQDRYYPGEDGLGSLHRDRRKVSLFRQPWDMKDEEFQAHCRMSKMDFFEFVRTCQGATLRMRDLNMYSQALLFQLKLCHDIPFDSLASMFSVSDMTAIRVFVRILLYQFINNCNIPNILDVNGRIVDAERDKLFQTAYNNTPAFMKQLLRDFKDPDPTRNRIGVALNADATYLFTQSSADIGKTTFYSFL